VYSKTSPHNWTVPLRLPISFKGDGFSVKDPPSPVFALPGGASSFRRVKVSVLPLLFYSGVSVQAGPFLICVGFRGLLLHGISRSFCFLFFLGSEYRESFPYHVTLPGSVFVLAVLSPFDSGLQRRNRSVASR